MNLISIKLDNTRSKTYRINKNGRLYIYQDIIRDYELLGGDLYRVAVEEQNVLLVVRHDSFEKTHNGVKLVRLTDNIYQFNLSAFLQALNINFPCKCAVDLFKTSNYKGFKISVLN